MADEQDSATAPPPELPKIYEAELASGPSGAVIRGVEIDFAAAVARRQAEENVVVCGDDAEKPQSKEKVMKHFTPGLIERFGSHDSAIANAALAEWEEAGDRYEAYLKAVEPRLPSGLRQIHARYYLHDSVVFGMGRQDGRFVIVLRLDTPPKDLLIFT